VRTLLLAAALTGAACTTAEAAAPACDASAAEAALLAAHAEILRAHREDDVDAWMALEADEQVVGNRGRISRSTADERRPGREAYLASAEFERYEDAVPPVVRVADDCSMGWVLVEVVASGVSRAEDGTEEPIDWRASWVELYDMTDAGWRLVGNVSNFAE
jgi:hypothetical protein